MLTREMIETFNEQGYVKGPKVLDDAQVDELRDEVLRVINERERKDIPQPVMCHDISATKSGTPLWQIVNIWMASGAFKNLVMSGTVAALVAELIDAKELRIWHDQIQYKTASGGGVNMWHQDSPYWGILTPKDQQVTAWVALDDVDEENGCMKMVPRSQHWGDAIEYLHTLKEFDDMEKIHEFRGNKVEVKTCPVKKGEVHFHHSLTWHGSGRNMSGRPRRAIALHFLTDQSRYLATGNHPMRQFVKVADGEVLKGDAFPLVWSADQKSEVLV